MDGEVDDLLSQLQLIQDIDGASHKYKRESLEKLQKLYKYSRKASLTRKAVVEIESAIEKLKSECQRNLFRSDDSCTEFYDLTEKTSNKSTKMRPQKHETYERRDHRRAPSQSRYESPRGKNLRERLQNVMSSVRSWTEVKEKKEYTRCSPRSDTDEDRDYRRKRKDRRSRRGSPGRYYRSRSRSPFRRDMGREHYHRRGERRGSVERYRRSHSYEARNEYTERRSRSIRRKTSSRRSSSHERDGKYRPKYFNEQVVKTEQLEEKDNENGPNSCTEPEPVSEGHVSASVVDQLRKKIRSTLQKSSNRDQNQTNFVVDPKRHYNTQEWQDKFDVDSKSSSEPSLKQIDCDTKIKQENATDNLQALEIDSKNLALDVQRKKIKFTFTKSLKTDASQVSSVFNKTTNDNLTNARSKLTTLLRSALNERNANEEPNMAAVETSPVQNNSSIDDDSIDQEIIQKIISQTEIRTSSSYELSVNVPNGFDSATAVKMLENKLSTESQRYTGTTFINSSATQLVRSNQYLPTDAQLFSPTVNTTTTQVVRSNYSSYLSARLPIPSTKFLPVVPLRAAALPRQPFDHNSFNAAINRNHCQATLCVETSNLPTTYGEHKNQLASREVMRNFKVPKKTTKMNITESDYKCWNNYDRPMSQQSNENTNVQRDKNSTAAPDPVANASKREDAREILRNYKIPKKTTNANRSTAPISHNKSVVERIKVIENDYENRVRHSRPMPHSSHTAAMESQSQQALNAIENDYDIHARPMSISPDPSVVELDSNGSEQSMDNDCKEWENYERPTSLQSHPNVQPDNGSTENDTASDPSANASKEASAMESLNEWMNTNEFATLVDLMQQLAQNKNLEKLKDALSNKNDVNYGESSSTATPAITATDESNGNTRNRSRSIPTFKNIDTAWHSLRKVLECQECDKPHGNSLVSHYVNEHPNSEILISRLAPEAVESLRSGLYESKVTTWKPQNKTSYQYKQFCYFCNVYRCFSKLFWIQHMARHTGYYRVKCNHCSRKFVFKSPGSKCTAINNFDVIPQPQFEKRQLLAYICDLCNFVRFHQHEIEMHLRNEHGAADDSKQFKEVKFLSFPNAEGKYVRKQYKKRKPKLVEEFLANLTDSDGEIDLKNEFDSEDEIETGSDETESDGGSDWSKMDIQDDEENESFSETNSDSDFV